MSPDSKSLRKMTPSYGVKIEFRRFWKVLEGSGRFWKVLEGAAILGGATKKAHGPGVPGVRRPSGVAAPGPPPLETEFCLNLLTLVTKDGTVLGEWMAPPGACDPSPGSQGYPPPGSQGYPPPASLARLSPDVITT